MVNVWTPNIYPEEVISMCASTLNLHPSLLPFYKGSHCATQAILGGGPFGVSLTTMTNELDRGMIYIQEEIYLEDIIPAGALQALYLERLRNLFDTHISDIMMMECTPRFVEKPSLLENDPRIKKTFKVKDTEKDRVRDIEDLDENSDVLRWIFANSFNNSGAILRSGSKKYELSLKEVR